MSSYVPLLRRRRAGATDYKARKRAVVSQQTLLVLRLTSKNASAQFVRPKVEGDVVLASAHSSALRKLGWTGPMKSTPACYLLGLLAGKKALGKGVKTAILYTGSGQFVRGSRTTAFLKGVVDAGVEVPVGEEVFPSEDRITGKTIADYASSVSKEDGEAYKAKFSSVLGRGFKPEEYPENFAKAKKAISGGASS